VAYATKVRRNFGRMFFVTALICAVFLPSIAAADQPSGLQVIVHASVLPTRYIIVSKNDTILKIETNSSDSDPTTLFYRYDLRQSDRVAGSASVLRDAAHLLKGITVRPGVLYSLPMKSLLPVKPSSLTTLSLMTPSDHEWFDH
jgi:hypothetical protein